MGSLRSRHANGEAGMSVFTPKNGTSMAALKRAYPQIEIIAHQPDHGGLCGDVKQSIRQLIHAYSS
ncbi:hypothetical protein [Brevibacillus massiliensis]|jgi:hypothetical protein|uniref:hypothetical protein n=1 Tax=Brevibacillus massiliensis TaxID=1118054 RepID=UPI0002F7520E|nr:hypothetical protein [Brevibacillus massiliensis]